MEHNLSLPVFLAFMAAFQNFQGGVMSLFGSLWTLLALKPQLDRLLPILNTPPERDEARKDPGKLNGEVEFANVRFSYDPHGPQILDNVSLRAKSGEFIAIVGPSGSGKSTLVRLLLGFVQPQSGAVLVGGKDLSLLDLAAVRRQMGVVLQSGKVMAGSILHNIIFGTPYHLPEAQRALELAALAEQVEEMPMGVHTFVNPETISGGQQQRILLARALVGQPCIVVLDESTSALDNVTQQQITTNLEHLHVTRIVIAHRLSTVMQADRIYVLERGRVVQSGTYEQLLAEDGLFRSLAKRQLAAEE